MDFENKEKSNTKKRTKYLLRFQQDLWFEDVLKKISVKLGCILKFPSTYKQQIIPLQISFILGPLNIVDGFLRS